MTLTILVATYACQNDSKDDAAGFISLRDFCAALRRLDITASNDELDAIARTFAPPGRPNDVSYDKFLKVRSRLKPVSREIPLAQFLAGVSCRASPSDASYWRNYDERMPVPPPLDVGTHYPRQYRIDDAPPRRTARFEDPFPLCWGGGRPSSRPASPTYVRDHTQGAHLGPPAPYQPSTPPWQHEKRDREKDFSKIEEDDDIDPDDPKNVIL